jgi:hypothetical protein
MLKRTTALLSVMSVAVFFLSVVAPTAEARTPAPGYSQFAGCPSPEERAEIEGCYTTTITSGFLKMGSKNVPIEKPITLSGGFGAAEKTYFNSKGGLTKVRQKVPGGIIGLTGLTWLAEILGSEALTLYAVTELAGTPGSPLQEPFTLPIKVHLENSTGVLGSNCYIGSNSNPITLNLTNETTSPPPPTKAITGEFGKLEVDPANENIIWIKHAKYVENAFAAPAASGCTLTLFGFIPISLNSLVDAQAGLPAAAGTNETVQVTDSEVTESTHVYP